MTACQNFPDVGGSGHYITSPSDGQTVRGTVTIAVTPPDNFSVDHVAVKIDQNLFKTLTTSPYTCEWDSRSDSYTNGQHQISVDIVDVNNQVKSDSINVYVDNH